MQISDYVLNNGMRVLIRTVGNAPIAGVWLGYRVGSRQDPPGKTGLSHWMEHMMFKGTSAYPGDSITRLLHRTGGSFNAYTNLDYTAYFVTLPVAQLELVMKLESDRMTNLILAPEQVEQERGVIFAERKRLADKGEWRLSEQVSLEAFREHPYSHPVIGWEEHLSQTTVDDLRRHYAAYYCPRNAVLAVTGNVDADQVRSFAERYFAAIPPGTPTRETIPQLPAPEETRRVLLVERGAASCLHLLYKVCSGAHPDVSALIVLSVIIGGWPAWGQALSSRGSRLHRVLVGSGLANAVRVQYQPTYDPGAFHIIAPAVSEQALPILEGLIEQQFTMLQSEPPAEEELARAKKRARAELAYLMDNVSRHAEWMGRLEIVCARPCLATLSAELDAVSAEDVRSVAGRYLNAANRTVGRLKPASD